MGEGEGGGGGGGGVGDEGSRVSWAAWVRGSACTYDPSLGADQS